jgi:hypothetical protein
LRSDGELNLSMIGWTTPTIKGRCCDIVCIVWLRYHSGYRDEFRLNWTVHRSALGVHMRESYTLPCLGDLLVVSPQNGIEIVMIAH